MKKKLTIGVILIALLSLMACQEDLSISSISETTSSNSSEATSSDVSSSSNNDSSINSNAYVPIDKAPINDIAIFPSFLWNYCSF